MMRKFQVGDTAKRIDNFSDEIPNYQEGSVFKIVKMCSDGFVIDDSGYYHWHQNIELVELIDAQTNNPKPQSNLEFLASVFADLVQSYIEKPSPDNAKRINLVIASIQKELGGGDALL